MFVPMRVALGLHSSEGEATGDKEQRPSLNSGPIAEIQPRKLFISVTILCLPLYYALVRVCSNLILVSLLVSSLNGMREGSADVSILQRSPFHCMEHTRVLQDCPGKRRFVGE